MILEAVFAAKAIASKFSRELGFVNRAALQEFYLKKGLEVIDGAGFVQFHHRRDRQTTIRAIAVEENFQKQGYGRLLFYRVLCAAIEAGSDRIVAKCPVDLSSNVFYSRLGFKLVEVAPGRKRALNCWQYDIKLPLLFYCGGGVSQYDGVAVDCGWRLGVRSGAKQKPIAHMEMVDNDWKNYDHFRHLADVRQHKPLIATVRDIESLNQLPELLAQARELAQYCGRVLLIPKVKFFCLTTLNIGWPFPFLRNTVER